MRWDRPSPNGESDKRGGRLRHMDILTTSVTHTRSRAITAEQHVNATSGPCPSELSSSRLQQATHGPERDDLKQRRGAGVCCFVFNDRENGQKKRIPQSRGRRFPLPDSRSSCAFLSLLSPTQTISLVPLRYRDLNILPIILETQRRLKWIQL